MIQSKINRNKNSYKGQSKALEEEETRRTSIQLVSVIHYLRLGVRSEQTTDLGLHLLKVWMKINKYSISMQLQIKDRHLACNMLKEKRVCKNVDNEPRLLPITGETRNNGRANTSHETRVDIQPRGFQVRGHSLRLGLSIQTPKGNSK